MPYPPPCSKWGSDYTLVRPKWRPYCRKLKQKTKSNKKGRLSLKPKTIKKILLLSNKTPKKGSLKIKSRSLKNLVTNRGTEKCETQSPEIIANFRKLANLDENLPKSQVCQKLKTYTLPSRVPTDKEIRRVAYSLSIQTKKKIGDKTGEDREIADILHDIEKNIMANLTPPLKKMIRLMKNDHGKFTAYQLVSLVSRILRPDGFPDVAPQPLSEKVFQEYAQIKRGAKSGKYLARDQEALLEQCLVARVCHCIKDRFLLHKFQYEGLMKSPKGPNPYALCQSRVFNREGLKGIGLKNMICDRRYDWFRRLKNVHGKTIPKFPEYRPVNRGKKITQK